ncbi:MAG TPA: SemiSWEET family transporter [Puia sp.]|jgi:MtN3 and saliva related transmembrane protein
MNSEQWVGLSASVCTTIALLPQLYKIIKAKKAENVSLLWIFILFAGLCGWILYGFLKKDIIIIISNIAGATLNGLIAIFAMKYKNLK